MAQTKKLSSHESKWGSFQMTFSPPNYQVMSSTNLEAHNFIVSPYIEKLSKAKL
jgi:hypothetical protein